MIKAIEIRENENITDGELFEILYRIICERISRESSCDFGDSDK